MQTLDELAKWHDAKADGFSGTRGVSFDAHTTAAATIRAAMGEIERAQEALRPFARFFDCLEVMGSNTPKTGVWYQVESSVVGERSLTIEDFAAVRAALNQKGPPMTDDTVALREEVARAMREAVLTDGEGNTYRLFDLLDFSGENKAHMVVSQLAAAALSAATPAIEARAREEMAKVAEEYQCSACGIWFHPSAGHYDEDCPKGRASWNGARESSAIAAAIRKG